MIDRANRTFVCSVLFLDIVGYSKRSVIEQLKLKQRLNAVLREALSGVPASDRIVLDTGDGAAISFLGNPEDSLFVALDLDAAFSGQVPPGEPAAAVRIGINLGPVRVVSDVNGQQNIVGDGINVAERVVGFADPGKILASRSYVEVVSRLSDNYQNLFLFEGTHTDKHVREHSVFTVDIANAAQTLPRGAAVRSGEATYWAGQGGLPVGKGLRLSVIGVTAVLAAAIIGSAWAIRLQRAPAQIAAAGTAEQAIVATPAAASPPPAAPRVASAEASATAPGAAAVGPGSERQPAKGDASVAVTLAITPWGEVYLDGKKQGISPPLKKITVSPGSHEVEVRNTSFPAFKKQFKAKSGSPIRIEHRFR